MSPPTKKQVVTLDKKPPYVQPEAAIRATGYAAGVAARHQGALPKYSEPRGGTPAPPIPALEQPHRKGMTMAQQAAQTRGQDSQRITAQAMQGHAAAGSIVVPDKPSAVAPNTQVSPQGLALQPGDILPEEATKDPLFHAGAGSRVAQSQPHMAAKYGVTRKGQHIPPQALAAQRQGPPPDFRGQRPARSAQDIANDFRQAQQAMSQPTSVVAEAEDTSSLSPPAGIPRTEQEADEQAAAGPAGVAQRTGQMPIAPILDAGNEDTQAQVKKMVDNLDDFDYERLRKEMITDALKNSKQREIVEKRLKPLDATDLIMTNKVRQRVPILPGVFEPTYESMPGDVELKLKQLLTKESKSIAVTEAYILDKYAVMTTTAGVVAINGNPVPSMYDAQGEFDEDRFWEKFKWMLRRNIHMLASLGIHYSWFEYRVRKLFVADEGKGG